MWPGVFYPILRDARWAGSALEGWAGQVHGYISKGKNRLWTHPPLQAAKNERLVLKSRQAPRQMRLSEAI